MVAVRGGMSAFVSELKAELRSKVHVVLWLTLSLVVAVSGPFGSYGQLNLLQRLVFWTPLLCLGVLISIGVRAFVHGVLGLVDFRHGSLLATALVCALVSPPLFFVIPATLDGNDLTLSLFVEIVLLVGSVSLGVCALRLAAEPERPTPPQAVMPEQRLIQRLAPGLRGPVLAISVRDHYVEVMTAQGISSLLMRFGDAIAEAGGDGAQVHRSHWVAWGAVVAVERDGARLSLRLASGAQVPVSKNHRAKLAARGLI